MPNITKGPCGYFQNAETGEAIAHSCRQGQSPERRPNPVPEVPSHGRAPRAQTAVQRNPVQARSDEESYERLQRDLDEDDRFYQRRLAMQQNPTGDEYEEEEVEVEEDERYNNPADDDGQSASAAALRESNPSSCGCGANLDDDVRRPNPAMAGPSPDAEKMNEAWRTRKYQLPKEIYQVADRLPNLPFLQPLRGTKGGLVSLSMVDGARAELKKGLKENRFSGDEKRYAEALLNDLENYRQNMRAFERKGSAGVDRSRYDLASRGR